MPFMPPAMSLEASAPRSVGVTRGDARRRLSSSCRSEAFFAIAIPLLCSADYLTDRSSRRRRARGGLARKIILRISIDIKRAAHDGDRLTAQVHGRDHAIALDGAPQNEARSAHVDTLCDAPGGLRVSRGLLCGEECQGRRRRAAGGRIL